MATKPMSDVWRERAVEAYEKGDLDSAEIRLIISDHLSPNDSAKKVLEFVRRQKLYHTPVADFSQFRDRKVDSEECIIIAKLAIERGNFEEAKKFLILAEKYCPSYYSKKLLKKVKYVENLRIRQQAKKGFAEKYTQDARAHFEVGNFSKAEKLLIKSLKVFSTIQAQSLLKRVQDAMEYERRNTQNNTSTQRTFLKKMLLNLLNIVTCNCLKNCGYIRLDEEHENMTGNRNTSSGNSYFYNADNMRFGSDNNTGHSSRYNTSGNHRNENNFYNTENTRTRNSNRNTSSGNSYFYNADNMRFGSDNDTGHSSRYNTSGNHRNENNFYNTENTRTRNSSQYNFTSDNIPGNNNSTGRRNNTGDPRNNAEGSRSNRNSTRYAYTFTQNDGNTTGPRNNPHGSRNNTQGTANNTHGPRHNTENSRGNTQDTRDNTRSSTRDNTSYTSIQLQDVKRVLNAKNDYEILGLPRDSTKKDIRTAFRKLSLLVHPDKNYAPGAKEAFMKINDAKDRLLKKLK